MSTAAQRAAEKAARLAAKHKEAPQPVAEEHEATPVSVPLPEADTTPVRVTVDFAPPLHDAFDAWARATNRKYRLGRPIKGEVLRALTRKLLDDEELRDEIIKTLIADRRK